MITAAKNGLNFSFSIAVGTLGLAVSRGQLTQISNAVFRGVSSGGYSFSAAVGNSLQQNNVLSTSGGYN